MKSARITLNFSDALARDEKWHQAGQRYLTFNCFVPPSASDIEHILQKLAHDLSPDDRFAVDLLELGNRELDKRTWISGYVFRHCSVDDSSFRLGSLDESEIDEIITLLDASTVVVDYAATEVISTNTRGGATNARKFNKRK